MKSKQKNLVEGKYSFEDLVDISHLRKMFERFSQATGFTTGLVSYPDQKLLIGTGWRDICTKFHRAFPDSEVHCKQSNLELTAYLKDRRKLNVRHCENGLVDGATPIIIKGAHVANLFTGQILFKKPDVEKFKKQGQAYKYDIDAYLEALRKVPIVSKKEFQNALKFLCEMAVMLAEQGLINLQNRETAQTAQESEDKFKSITENAVDFIFIKDMARRYTFVNRSMLEMLALSEKEIIGKTPQEIFGTEQEHIIKEVDDRTFSGENVNVTRSLLIGDKEFFFNTMQTPLTMKNGKVTSIMGIVRDVTERKRAEEESLKLAAAVKHSGELVNLSTLDGKMVFLNEAGGRILGIDPQNIGNVNIMEVIPVHLVELVENELLPTLKKGEIWEGDLQYQNLQTGKLTDVHAMTFTVKDPDTNEPQFLANVSMDITERKLMEEELRESKERFQAIAEDIPVMICRFLPNYKITYVNEAYCKFFNKNSGELIGHSFLPMIAETDRELVTAGISSLTVKAPTQSHEHRVITPDGKIHWQRWTNRALFDVQGKLLAYQSIGEDITERKRTEEELQTMQRLKSVGILAGGIAHDFNNILMGLYGNISLAREMFSKDPHPASKFLDDAESSMSRATRLTKQLLIFTKA